MLNHPTLDKLIDLRLFGMHKALLEQAALPDLDSLAFEERLALLVDRESTVRANRRLERRLRSARLRQNAAIEDLDLRAPRGIDRSVAAHLAASDWIGEHHNVLITGPTGVGKTWIACALAHKACRDGYSVSYQRLSRLLGDLRLAHADGRLPKLMHALSRTDLLVLDDFGLERLADDARRDLLELLDDRHRARATIVTSQLPVDRWHEVIGEPTLADAILDRLVHGAYRLALKGESMRKARAR